LTKDPQAGKGREAPDIGSTTEAKTDDTIAGAGYLAGSRHIDRTLLRRLVARIFSSDGGTEHSTKMPFTGEVLGAIPLCTGEDLREAARRARAAQGPWSRWSFEERAGVFLRYHDLLLERQEEILDLMQLETGKARKDAFEEVADSAVVSRYYARTTGDHLKTRRRKGAFPVLTLTREVRQPKGLVGIIAPWNYPLTLAISDAVPALMAGNAVLLKPDKQTSFTALWGVDLLYEAGLPRDLFQVVTGEGPDLGPPLIESVDYVGFTGSTRTGRIIARQAGERLIGCSLELGGKNAMLVLEDADLDKTVEGAIRACFANAGQLCISTERLFAHEVIYDRFVERFARRARSMKMGVGLDWEAEMGTLVSAKQLEVVERHIRDAVEKGARVLVGGRARPDLGHFFYEPTVLEDARAGMELFAEETFGPVATVEPFSDIDEAIRKVNDSPYGLNASVWTRDTESGFELAKRIRAGTVNVNEAYGAAWLSTDAPMGGMKDSGLGRRHGAEGLQKYTESQTIAVQRLLPVGALPGVGEERYSKLMTGVMRALTWTNRMPGLRRDRG
jgi:succinate-semialdehyde dehydrogenase/glutarate-semialdehyde dehydrogenase